MFKVPKKKKAVVNRSIRKGSDVDENEDHDSANLEIAMKQAKQKRKLKSKQKDKKSISLSFNIDDEEQDGFDQARNEKRQRGMGFGGMVQDEDDNEEGKSVLEVIQNDVNDSGPSSLYSKSQLEKLKSEQKKYDVPVSNNTNEDDEVIRVPSKDAPSVIELPPQPSKHTPVPPEEDFISLDTHILAGDEALKHTNEDIENDSDPMVHLDERNNLIKSLHIESTMAEEALKGHMNQVDEEKESKSWEDAVARRAGISLQSDSVTYNTPTSKEKDLQLMSKVKDTISRTLENLELQDEDLARKISRQKMEVESAGKEAKKNEDNLDSIGSMFEYYQQLRSDLVNWIGALRHLSEKVNLIEEAIKDLLVEISLKRVTRRREWEDDCVTILQEKGYLDYVIGRQPSILTDKKDIPKVDEFGRDIQSLESLARAKRKSDRLRRQEESRNRKNDEINDDVSDNEMMQYEERRSALVDAVQVVLDEMSEEYTSLNRLLEIFDGWKARSEDDYKQCYASLALLQFIGIFIEVEVSKTVDLGCLIKETSGHPQSIQDFSWFRTIRDSSYMKNHTVGEMEEFYSYLARNFLWNTLKTNIRGTKDDTVTEAIFVLDLLSKKQCSLVGKFYESISHYCDNHFSDQMASYFCAYIDSYIKDFAVPILVRSPKLTDATQDDDDFNESIKYSTLKQIQIFGHILSNILTTFYPILSNSETIGKYCLIDIIAQRILPIVEASLAVYPDEIKSEFQSIFQIIKKAGLIDSSTLMMASAPLRAASLRYGEG